MPTILVFLQNPWSKLYAGHEWPRESWLRALGASRSGQRLRVMTEAAGERFYFHFDNANPRVGATPDSRFPADLGHMATVIQEQKPRLIVACGREAEKAITGMCFVPLIVVPHPAHRLLTNELYSIAGRLIREDFSGWVALRQGNGHVVFDETIKTKRDLQNG